MKYVFFGSPEFAAIILEKLIAAGFIPAAVICNPDRPVGRKQTIVAPPAKLMAQKCNIPVFQPESLEAKNWELEIGKIKIPAFDFFVVAAYAKIIPQNILDIPRLGTIGVHPSLLPKYRGASPIQSAILKGEEKTSITLYLLDEKMDHGPILAIRELVIEDTDDFFSLRRKLGELGGQLLTETLPRFIQGEIKPRAQDESGATYTRKFKIEDGYIEPQELERAQKDGGETALALQRKIRALIMEPGAWTIKNGKRMKIIRAYIPPDGKLKLKEIQFEGKKPEEVR